MYPGASLEVEIVLRLGSFRRFPMKVGDTAGQVLFEDRMLSDDLLLGELIVAVGKLLAAVGELRATRW